MIFCVYSDVIERLTRDSWIIYRTEELEEISTFFFLFWSEEEDNGEFNF